MTDYADDLKSQLEGDWLSANITNNITPTFDTNWEWDAWAVANRIVVRELSSTHEYIGGTAATQFVNGLYQIDIWSNDRTVAKDMRDEVDRIINAWAINEITGITIVSQTQWKDMTDWKTKQLYRYTLTLEAWQYVDS